jgi:ribulose-5-phosphate 4-epimerase/fuculose-1-phosphate aldolase
LANLGDKQAMLLRNHGSLTWGRTIAEAYVLMDTLDKACTIQLKAQAGGGALHRPSDEVCRRTQLALLGDGSPEGKVEWPALLRKLDQQSPGYRC